MNTILKLSQLNGLIGDLFNGFGNFIKNFISATFGYLMCGWYQIVMCPLLLLIDGIQIIFRKFAGLDTYYIEGEAQSGDIVLSLINNPVVQNVFWSLVILAVVLLFITTIVALIRAETQADGKERKTKGQIFVQAIKGLVNFFMVPVVAILGIFMGNALLKSLDQATSGSSIRISGMVFKACAYECNRARYSEVFAHDLAVEKLNNMGVLQGTVDNIDEVVDDAFANFVSFKPTMFNFKGMMGSLFSSRGSDYLHVLSLTLFSTVATYLPRTCFSVYDAIQVYYYYDLGAFNYIFGLLTCFFVLWVLLATSLALTKRIFKLIMLLLISPPIAALMPIDNGNSLGKWRKEFIGSTLSAYSTVVGLNLTLLILGPLSSIDFFAYSSSYVGVLPVVLNNIMQLIILVGGLYFFKDMTKSLAGIIGAENAYEEGSKAAQDLGKKAAQAAAVAVTAGGAAAAGLKGAELSKFVKSDAFKKGLAEKSAKLEGARENLENLKKGSNTSIVDNLQKEINGLINEKSRHSSSRKKKIYQYKIDKKKAELEEAKKNVSTPEQIEEAQKEVERLEKDYKLYESQPQQAEGYQQKASALLKRSSDKFLGLATNGVSDDFKKELAPNRDKNIDENLKDASKKIVKGGFKPVKYQKDLETGKYIRHKGRKQKTAEWKAFEDEQKPKAKTKKENDSSDKSSDTSDGGDETNNPSNGAGNGS